MGRLKNEIYRDAVKVMEIREQAIIARIRQREQKQQLLVDQVKAKEEEMLKTFNEFIDTEFVADDDTAATSSPQSSPQ